jgi:uncharacterized protein
MASCHSCSTFFRRRLVVAAMRPLPQDGDKNSPALSFLYNSVLMAGLISFAIAQLAKPVTYWCGLDGDGSQHAVEAHGNRLRAPGCALCAAHAQTHAPCILFGTLVCFARCTALDHRAQAWHKARTQQNKAMRTPCRHKTLSWEWQRMVSSGGMPSSHTALISGLTAAVGAKDGVGSSVFGICLVVALIVSYDAASVRRAAGKHAAVLNAMMAELPLTHAAHGPLRPGETLGASLGHTPLQVVVGAVLGFTVGVLLQSIR